MHDERAALAKSTFTIEREIVVSKDGTDHRGILRIVCEPTHDPPRCRYVLPVIHGRELNMYGEDMLQALTLCLRTIRSTIEMEEEYGTQIWWTDPGDRCML